MVATNERNLENFVKVESIAQIYKTEGNNNCNNIISLVEGEVEGSTSSMFHDETKRKKEASYFYKQKLC